MNEMGEFMCWFLIFAHFVSLQITLWNISVGSFQYILKFVNTANDAVQRLYNEIISYIPNDSWLVSINYSHNSL